MQQRLKVEFKLERYEASIGITEQKSRETREQLKSGKIREIVYACKYTSGIKSSLAYLQV